MANLTRIKNNQITDSTILANTKIVPGSIVGSLFNSNITVTSDFTITGNLTVQGSSTYLTVASTNTYVNDPLIVMNNAFSGTNTYDIGLLINRGDQTSTAMIWKESNKQFELTYTSDTGTTYGAINNSGYANLKVGNLTVAGVTTIADIGAGNLTLSGDLAVNGGDITTTNATATVFNANATTVSAFGAATTLGIGAGTGTLTLNNATVTTPGQIISTRAGSATTGDGQIFLNGSTSNRIDWAGAGTGAPTFTTRTDGTKVVLYPALSGSTVDYAIGIDAATMWSSVPENGDSFNFKWYGAETLVANLSGTGNFTTVGDVAVNGGDLTTTAATFNLIDTDATTVNFAGAATTIDLGATTGTLTINNPTVVGSQTTQDLYNTTATTLNFAGAATTLIVGATTGIANIRNATTNIIGNTTVGGDTTLTANLAVNGGDITTSAGTFNLINANATTVDAFKAATDLEFGATSGTLTINNPTVVGTQTSQDLYNTTATTLNFAGAATTLIVGATTGIANIRNATTNIIGNATVGGTLAITGDTTLTGDLAVNGGDLTTTSANATVFNTNATTVDAFKAATDLEFGATSGTLTINNPTVVGTQSSQDLYNTTATTLNFAGAATTLIVGATTGIANIRNATTNVIGNATIGGTLAVTGDTTLTGDLAVNGGDLTTTTTGTFNLLDAIATTVNAFGAATAIDLGATSGTLTINNPTVVGTQATQALYNTTATTLNIGGAATALNLGASSGNTTVQNNLITTGNVNIDATTQSTNSTSGALIVAGGVGVAKNLNVGGNVVVTGDLTVNGNVTTLNTATLDVEDLNITVAKGAADSAAADGAGLTVDGAGATILYTHATTSWNLNKHLIGTSAQFSTTLGVTGDTTLTANLAVNGGDLTTTATTFNLLDATATTVNALGAATAIDLGATSGTLTINNPTVVGSQASQDLYNTTATTLNFAGAATTLIVGATTGVANIRNATTNILGNATVGGTLGITGDVTLTGDLAVNGGDITTTASTATVFNTTATTVNAFGAATTLGIGATSGTTTVNNNLTVGASGKLLTVNGSMIVEGGAYGNVTTTQFGAVYARAYGANSYSLVQAKTNDNTTGMGMQAFTGAYGQIYSNSGFEFRSNATVRDLDIPTGGTVYVTISNTGIVTLGNDIVSSTTTQNVFNTVATTVNAFGAATTLIVGATTGVANIRNATTNIIGNATVGGTLDVTGILNITGAVTLTDDLAVNGGDITTTASTFNLVNANATTVDAFKAATDLEFGATTGTLTINNPTVVGTQTTQNLYNTTATTVNAFGAATAINMGAASGVVTVAGNANIQATTTSTISTEGALRVAGGVGIAGNVHLKAAQELVVGNEIVGRTHLSNAPAQFFGNVNGNVLVHVQNTNSGANATAGFRASVDSGNVAAGSIVMGILNSGYDGTTFPTEYRGSGGDGYIYVTSPGAAIDITGGLTGEYSKGGNLFIGTDGFDNSLYFFAGGDQGGGVVGMQINGTYGNIQVNMPSIPSISSTTGAFTVAGGVGLNTSLNVGSDTTINTRQTNEGSFTVKGARSTALIYTDPLTDSVVIGGGHYQGSGGNITIQPGVTLKIDATDTMLMPVGSTAQRPSNSGNVDVTGMTRFNNTINNLEFYDGSMWQSAGSVFTIISDRQFSLATGNLNGNVNGVNTEFTLQSESTTAATIVSINGVIQIPVLAYDVNLDLLTFTEAPALGDIIDVRCLATTTVLKSLASANGLNQVIVDNTGVQIWSGSSVTTQQFSIDTSGDATFERSILVKQYATFDKDVTINGNLTVKGGSSGTITIGDATGDNVVFNADVNSSVIPNTNDTFDLGSTSQGWANVYTNKIVAIGAGTSVGTSAVVIDSFAKATYRTAKYVLSVSNSGTGEYETTEVLVIHNDTTATRTQYGTVYTGSASLGSVTVAVNGANVELSYTGVAAGNVVKVQTTYVKV